MKTHNTISALLSSNTERILFSALLFLFPTQLGRHFWPAYASIQGLRVDYLSPTLYLTDALLIVLFVVTVVRLKKKTVPVKNYVKKLFTFRISHHLFIAAFAAVLLLNGLVAQNKFLWLEAGVRTVELVFFGWYLAKRAPSVGCSPAYIATVIAVSVASESLLAIAQFALGGSIGGPLYLVGERTFTGTTPGIANVSLEGKLLLRPYGTLPHPNVLAGFLAVSMTLLLGQLLSTVKLSLSRKVLFFITLVLGMVALVLTMSRVALVAFIGASLYVFVSFLKKQGFYSRLVVASLLLLVLLGVFLSPIRYRFISFTTTDESFVYRQESAGNALAMIKNNPFLGVGYHNFLLQQQSSFGQSATFLSQPVHNVYLLFLAEVGIVGFLLFIYFVFRTYKRLLQAMNRGSLRHRTFFAMLSMLLLLGVFDHYLLTIQQGRLLLALVFGLCWSRLKA